MLGCKSEFEPAKASCSSRDCKDTDRKRATQFHRVSERRLSTHLTSALIGEPGGKQLGE